MLTEGQIKYLAKVPDDQKMVVKPFDPKGLEIAEQIISDIKAVEPNLLVRKILILALFVSSQSKINILIVLRNYMANQQE